MAASPDVSTRTGVCERASCGAGGIPTMPGFYGIKDSHRSGKLVVEPDSDVNAFIDSMIVPQPPGLLDGDTSMGNCVTSASRC